MESNYVLFFVALVMGAVILFHHGKSILSKKEDWKTLCKKAAELCDKANEGDKEALAYIKRAMANEESPLHFFFYLRETRVFLTEEAKWMSERSKGSEKMSRPLLPITGN